MSTTTYKKVFICDILKNVNKDDSADSRPGFGTNYMLDVMGTVLLKSKGRKLDNYFIDDGTGVIRCIRFHRSLPSKQDDGVLQAETITNQVMTHVKGSEGLTTDIRNGIEKLLSRLDDFHGPVFEHGDKINVLGKFNIYNGTPQVEAKFIKKMEDPNADSQRILELICNYHHVK